MKKNIPSENKKTHKTINPIGRPTKYNNELADKIVDIIATSNRSIASICKEFGLSPSTIYDWIENNKDFSDKYARAKEWQADYMAEEIIEISDNATNDYMTIRPNREPDMTQYDSIGTQ